jgi:hypothetical protein
MNQCIWNTGGCTTSLRLQCIRRVWRQALLDEERGGEEEGEGRRERGRRRSLCNEPVVLAGF